MRTYRKICTNKEMQEETNTSSHGLHISPKHPAMPVSVPEPEWVPAWVWVCKSWGTRVAVYLWLWITGLSPIKDSRLGGLVQCWNVRHSFSGVGFTLCMALKWNPSSLNLAFSRWILALHSSFGVGRPTGCRNLALESLRAHTYSYIHIFIYIYIYISGGDIPKL